MQDIYDTTEMRASDEKMLMTLHTVAATLGQQHSEFEKELRTIADRFSELTKAAHNRKHWTGHE